MMKPRLYFALLLISLLTACAAIKEPKVDPNLPTETLVPSDQRVLAFFTLTLVNRYKEAKIVHLASMVQRLDGAQDVMAFKNEGADLSVDSETVYLVPIQLDPGKFKLREIQAKASDANARGYFTAPLNFEVNLDAPGYIYLGHIRAENVERKNDDELRAGPLLPLVDQAMIGASGGTFKITVDDRWNKDKALIVGAYPVLKGKPVRKQIIPSPPKLAIAKAEQPKETKPDQAKEMKPAQQKEAKPVKLKETKADKPKDAKAIKPKKTKAENAKVEIIEKSFDSKTGKPIDAKTGKPRKKKSKPANKVAPS